MKPNSRKSGVLLATLLPILAASGCTGTDVLKSGTGQVDVLIELDNIAGRFVDNAQADVAFIDFRQINVRPEDPQADAALGAAPLGLLRTSVRANFVADLAEPRTVAQASGTYRFIRLIINRIDLTDADDLTVAGLSDPLNPPCHDFIKRVNMQFTGQGTVFAIAEADLNEKVTFDVDADNRGSLTMRVDYPAYIAALNDSLNCSTCSCPAAYTANMNNIPRFCSINGNACTVTADCPQGQTCRDCTCPVSTAVFNRAMFKSLAPTFLDFE